MLSSANVSQERMNERLSRDPHDGEPDLIVVIARWINQVEMAENLVLPSDAPTSAPETPDTDKAVQCALERLAQERIASKLRDPALNHISKVASDGGCWSRSSQVQERAV